MPIIVQIMCVELSNKRRQQSWFFVLFSIHPGDNRVPRSSGEDPFCINKHRKRLPVSTNTLRGEKNDTSLTPMKWKNV